MEANTFENIVQCNLNKVFDREEITLFFQPFLFWHKLTSIIYKLTKKLLLLNIILLKIIYIPKMYFRIFKLNALILHTSYSITNIK